MTGRVTWHGDKLLTIIRDATPDALFAGAEELIEAAAAKAPKRSGDLASSGYVSSTEKSTYKRLNTNRKETKPLNEMTVVAGFADFKAAWYELGAENTAARPYLRPALDELKDKIGATIVEKIGRKLE